MPQEWAEHNRSLPCNVSFAISKQYMTKRHNKTQRHCFPKLVTEFMCAQLVFAGHQGSRERPFHRCAKVCCQRIQDFGREQRHHHKRQRWNQPSTVSRYKHKHVLFTSCCDLHTRSCIMSGSENITSEIIYRDYVTRLHLFELSRCIHQFAHVISKVSWLLAIAQNHTTL
jgi:hypothetical protein